MQQAERDYSAEFYRQHAWRYAEVAHEFIQSVYVRSSHPRLNNDADLLERLQELVSGNRGLDAGCGAGARDVYNLWSAGYDVFGVDAIEENIAVARELHPEISDRVSMADLSKPLPLDGGSFDFVLCNAVIQHIAADLVMSVTLPELVRMLRPGGVLQLMFKVGEGVVSVYDRDYEAERSFRLYGTEEIVGALERLGVRVIPPEGEKLGGLMYFTDPKAVEHCALFGRKGAGADTRS